MRRNPGSRKLVKNFPLKILYMYALEVLIKKSFRMSIKIDFSQILR